MEKNLPYTRERHLFLAINVIQFKIKSFDKKNKHLHVNIYFSVWESTFIHTLCISVYKMLQPNVNLTECGRINGTLCFILKILFNEYVYLYAAALYTLLYFNIQRDICICNAFPVSKHHLLILTLHFRFWFLTNKYGWLEYILILLVSLLCTVFSPLNWKIFLLYCFVV